MTLRLYTFVSFLLVAISISAQSRLRITSPASIAGDYAIGKGLLGNGFSDTLRGELIIANNGNNSTLACDTIANNVKDKIVLIDRGNCTFVEKALRAQRAGAKAVILCNNTIGLPGVFGSPDPAITIPYVMISQADCIKIKPAANGAQGFLYFSDPTGAEPVLYSETFNGGKGAWTTKGISNAKDTFTWDSRGISDGALGGFVIDAPTADNGAMVFDADFLTTGGDTLKIPNGPPPYPNHRGELISPVINCSSFSNVTLKFFEVYAALNSSTFISYSTDGGNTWATPIEINEDIQPNQATTRGKFIKYELPQLAGKAQARFKFIFDGDFYTWIIDDVKLLGKSQFDVAVQPKQFFFPFNFATPASQISTDTSFFSTDVANYGLGAATNVKLKVSITNSAGAFLHRDSIVIANLPANAVDTTFFFPKMFVPGRLPAGTYTLSYAIEGSSGSPADADPTNNIQSQVFLLTTDLYSKDDGVGNNSGLRANNEGDYFFGNLYTTASDWNANDKFKATEVTFGAFMPSSDGVLKGKSATIYLAELLPTVAADFSNFEDKAITENPAQLKIVGLGTYEFKENQSETPTITLQDFNTFNDKVDIKKGTRYLVGVSYKEGLSKAYQFVESDIQYFWVSSLFFANGQWSASPDAPVIRMRIELSTAVDLVKLPETTLKLMPNPTTDYIRAAVNFEKPTNVNFTIADIQGRVMQFIPKKNVTKETYDFDTRSYVPGTYLMRISTDEGTRTMKFVVQK